MSACVLSCPSPSSVSRSKRLAFELLWKWSMPYGQSRCGLTWFGFNTSPQEVHKASRSSFVMLVIFLRGPAKSLLFFLEKTKNKKKTQHNYCLIVSLFQSSSTSDQEFQQQLRRHLILYPVTKWTMPCFFKLFICIQYFHIIFSCISTNKRVLPKIYRKNCYLINQTYSSMTWYLIWFKWNSSYKTYIKQSLGT